MGEPSFRNGGRWIVHLNDAKTTQWDEFWKSSILTLIGEAFVEVGSEESVCGVVASVWHDTCRVELWLSDLADEDQVLAIGRFYQYVLAEIPGLWDNVAQKMTFEDFSKRKAVVQLAGPKAS